MFKKQQLLNSTFKSNTNEIDYDSSKSQKQSNENQFDISQKLLYALEKPTINTKNTNSCRNSTGRLSVFDFLNLSITKANKKKTFSIKLNYLKNDKTNFGMIKQSTNLYGFSKVSSKNSQFKQKQQFNFKNNSLQNLQFCIIKIWKILVENKVIYYYS
ncbi:unnamed protein product [Paramecium primaurelia]|uniref:Uncharacterized protein n=1 Tax=Paramecium primaurelia TaxID=5886 RepID=A0A8S1K629_PARPR|nr:unnamed protein product [Paramecium primaurelia]